MNSFTILLLNGVNNKPSVARTIACILVVYIIGFGLGTQKLYAQLLDSAKIRVGTIVSVASQDYQPLWLVSNRWGTISDQQVDVATYLTFHDAFALGSWTPIQNYGRRLKKRPTPRVSYGFSLYNNQLFRQTRLQEGYVKLNLGHWQLAAGRYQEVIGEVPSQISSGSLGVSSNALPIPKVSLGLAEYTDLPFIAPGWVQVKGQASVGWMEEDAYVDKAKFHHRSLYFQVGKRSVISRKNLTALSLFGGLNHFVIWGGKHPDRGKMADEWKNLTKIIVPGNNLGFFDYGFTLLTQGIKIRGYTQVPFEGKGNINPFRIKDRMVGITVSDTRKGSYFPTITLEAINSTWQDPNQERISRAADYNFYNNTLYADGWSYGGRILGTPLFFDRQRATQYFGENFNTNPNYDWNIVNNRINGVHIGAKGQIPFEKLYYRTLATFTINHGNYYVPGLFVDRSRNQFYFMQELAYQYHALTITGTLGGDVGGLTKNMGALLGVEYDLNYQEKTRPTRYRGRKRPSGRRW